jgi:hypothetical protein
VRLFFQVFSLVLVKELSHFTTPSLVPSTSIH